MSDLKRVDISENAPYINALFWQMLQGVEEVLGENGLNAVLRTSGLGRYIGNPPKNNLESSVLAREYARLNEAIEQFTGRAGKGMLQRIGRASFRWGIKEQAAVMGLATGKDFREFEIVETLCRARGDDCCRFEIRDRV